MTSSPAQRDRQRASQAMARLLPHLIQGAQLEFFAKQNITQTQFVVLVAVFASGRCTMGPLAKKLHVRMPTATGIVSRLERAGYVRRTPAAEDRRRVVVTLTGKGRRFIKEFQGIVQRRWQAVLGSLQTDEVRAFAQLITKITAALQQMR